MREVPATIKVIVTLLYWLVTFSMFIALLLRGSDMPEIFGKGLFRIGASWLFFSCLAAVILLGLDITSRYFTAIQGNLWWALGVAALIFAYGNYNHRHPQAVPLDITLNKPMKGELKMAVMSDLHLGYGTGKKELKKFVELINSHNPDIIIIAGDLIDNNVKLLRDEHFEEELLQLKAPQGVFMVPGNHEYISGIEECKDFIKTTNIKMLCDSVITLPCGVQVLLRDDSASKHRKKLKKVFKQIDKSKPIVLVDHCPIKIAENDSAGVDLQLSGHTHHGQVWPGNIITDFLYEQSHGYRKWNNAHVWVSSGISLWGPPVRLGTKGDYAIITLRGTEE